jgi:hypothetical protein
MPPGWVELPIACSARPFDRQLRACQGKSEEKGAFVRNSGKSAEIERAWAARTRAFDDVEVNHGGGDVGMAEEILNGSDVGAVLEEGGCIRVTERDASGTVCGWTPQPRFGSAARTWMVSWPMLRWLNSKDLAWSAS